MEGRVFKFGDHVDTDLIIPARYLNTTDPAELAQHCLEDADPSFAREVRPGDIIVAGVNFGCGSSREHAPLAIKAAGVACVIAKSFARIFYRNAFNIGLPLLECSDALRIPSGSRVRVDLSSGRIEVLDTGEVLQARSIPDFMQAIIGAGGLIPYVEQRLRGR
ncbi:3-isopropylmalate dehydratase small subunit [Desulfothermobacter acidiphilus]|uniref:3-isopropylmalate dehydratase small subunit n=1 Tax=Desulfothermobacter acidiphilus TaxID=1938353 RepID=UPI003F8CB79A